MSTPEKTKPHRVRSTTTKKWRRTEEVALINFIKKNRDFEKPCARFYYTKFLFESGIDVDWKLVRSKVRNMRVSYRRVKEYEINKAESTDLDVVALKNKMLRNCWYADDFDILFPNIMNNEIDPYYDPFLDDDGLSKEESFCNGDKNNFLREEESTASSLSKSIGGDIVAGQKNMLNIKKEKQDDDTSIRQQEPEKVKEKYHDTRFREREMGSRLQQTKFRNRKNPIRKWQRHEEVAIISFLKQNKDFEYPNSRIFYTKFLNENGIDAQWINVRSKVRNMRVSYRKAKEHEIKEGDTYKCNIQALRNQILKICWFVDDFDIIFPNEMDNSASLQIYNNPDLILDDDFSKNESLTNCNNSSNNLKRDFLLEEDSTTSSLSNSRDGDILTVQNNFFNLKKQKRDDPSIKKQYPEKVKGKYHDARLKKRGPGIVLQQTKFRNRFNPIRKWQRNEEFAIITFLKQNHDFEQPNKRIYYTKFLNESGIDAEWTNVRSKVRNMRASYRKAKEYEIKEGESYKCNTEALRHQILKICWFVDDFDILFPNEMDNYEPSQIYKNSALSLEDDISKDESFINFNNSSNNLENNFLLEEDSSTSSLSNSMNGDICTMQNNFIRLKEQKRQEDTSLKQQEFELAKEKLNFEREKFLQEIRLKEKEIENEEKLKIMEFEMKERIANKKLEIEEMIALKSIKKPNNSYNDIYHNLT